MVNFVKVQTDVVKALAKCEKVYFAEDEKNVYITEDGFALYAIPKQCFYLDTAKLKCNKSFISIVEKYDKAKPVKFTGEIKVINEKIKALKYIIEESGEEVYLQEKYAKLCDKWFFFDKVFFGTCKGVLSVVAMYVKV